MTLMLFLSASSWEYVSEAQGIILCLFELSNRCPVIKKSLLLSRLFISGRDERIRTSDILHPMQALYQAELRPE